MKGFINFIYGILVLNFMIFTLGADSIVDAACEGNMFAILWTLVSFGSLMYGIIKTK